MTFKLRDRLLSGPATNYHLLPSKYLMYFNVECYVLYFTQQKSIHTCRFVPWYKVHCHWGKSRTYMYSILSHFSVTRTNLHMVQLHYRIRYRLFTRIHHAILFKLIENVTYIPSTQTHMYTSLCMWNWSAAVSYYIEHCKFLRRIHIYALTVIPYNIII